MKISATDQLVFSPESRTVHVGDIVQWTNTGSVPHSVTFNDHASLSDATLAPGDTWEVKITVAGTYPYLCTYHQPGMVGTLVIR